MMTDLYELQGTGLELTPDEPGYRLPAVPQRMPAPTTWQERLVAWRPIRATPVWRELPEVSGGNLSERRVRALLKVHHSTTFGSIFGGKRVPRDAQAAAMGRYETDLIVLTPRRVVVIEVKNWSGRLRPDPDNPRRWTQERRSGEIRTFDDPIAHNRSKLGALRSYLQNCGVDLPARRFHQALVLDNPSLQVEESISRHPAVITDAQLDVAIGRGTGVSTAALARLIQRCYKQENAVLLADEMLDVMTPAQQQSARAAIARLRTWDCLTLRGGRVLRGDLLWIRLGDQQLQGSSLEPGSELALRWCRDSMGWVTVVLAGMAPGRASGNLLNAHFLTKLGSAGVDQNDCVFFHEVGQAQPYSIALHCVDHIRIG